jgi:FtsH-binding integral membrane protein
MAFGSDRKYMTPAQAEAAQIDVGLRQYMLKVYNYMASGLALTGIVALLVSMSPQAMMTLFGTPLKWVVIFAPVVVVMVFAAKIGSMRASTAQGVFWLYAGLMGLSLSSIFLAYTGVSITRTFFVTAAAFAGLSLYGYTTKRNLSGLGSFLVMGLWGLIIASVINIFLASSALQFVVSCAGVLIFAGLTAWDTQSIKQMYYENYSEEDGTKVAILGALNLYMDFINLFMFLLQFLGDRRSE